MVPGEGSIRPSPVLSVTVSRYPPGVEQQPVTALRRQPRSVPVRQPAIPDRRTFDANRASARLAAVAAGFEQFQAVGAMDHFPAFRTV